MTILSRSFFFSKGASDQVPQLGIEAASSPRHSSKSPVPSSGFSFQTISLLGQKGNGDASVDQQDNRPTSPSIPPPPTIGASSIFIWRSRDDPTVLSSPIQSFLPSSPNDRDTKQRSRSRRLPIFFHSYSSTPPSSMEIGKEIDREHRSDSRENWGRFSARGATRGANVRTTCVGGSVLLSFTLAKSQSRLTPTRAASERPSNPLRPLPSQPSLPSSLPPSSKRVCAPAALLASPSFFRFYPLLILLRILFFFFPAARESDRRQSRDHQGL